MKELSKKEILGQLEKLGIDSTSELNSCLMEYKEFSKSSHTFSAKTLSLNKIFNVFAIPKLIDNKLIKR
jgi:hypothetical protein